MIWLFAGIISILFLFNFVGWLLSAPKYKGPVSDHFNGKTFINPGNAKAKNLREALVWASQRKREPWQELRDIPPGQKPEGKISKGVKLTFVNHSTVLIQVEGINILTDPVWSKRVSPVQFTGPKRMRPPGIRFEDLPHIDYVLLSHNHYDHLDRNTLKKIIDQFNPKIYTPLGVGAYVTKLGAPDVFDMDWWDALELNPTIGITCVPAQHFSGRGTFDRDATLWCGYVLSTKEGNIYYAGDSGYGSFFKEIGDRCGPMKVSMIPIGAYIPKWFMSPIHMSPEQAVQAHEDVKSEKSMAIHFGTFPLADDGQEQPIQELDVAIHQKEIRPDSFVVVKEGENLYLD